MIWEGFCFIFLGTIFGGSALDLEGAREGLACFEPPTVQTDLTWMNSVKKWHFIEMSRLDLYVFAQAMTGRPAHEIREDELYYESCITWRTLLGSTNKTTTSAVGFHGKDHLVFNVEFFDDHFGKFNYSTADESLSAVAFTTLTDNATFVVYVNCLASGFDEMTWFLASPTPTLPKETILQVEEHVKGLGFKPEQFTGMRYGQCKCEDDDDHDDDD